MRAVIDAAPAAAAGKETAAVATASGWTPPLHSPLELCLGYHSCNGPRSHRELLAVTRCTPCGWVYQSHLLRQPVCQWASKET